MSLPESVQAFNDQITVTMNNDIQGGAGHEGLSADTMVTSIANEHLGDLDGDSKQALGISDTATIPTTMCATQLMQTIIKATQNSHDMSPVQQTSDIKNANHVPLPADLQSFKGDPFTLLSPTHNPAPSVFQTSNFQPVNDHLDLNKDSSPMMGHHSQNPMFSAVTSPEFAVTGSSFGTVSPPQLAHQSVPSHQTQIFTSFSNPVVSSQQMPTSFSEALHLNMPDNNLNFDSLSKNPALPTFENSSNVNAQMNTDFGVDKSSVLERLLTSEQNLENKLNNITSPGSKSVSSPDYPTGSPSSSSNSPYADGNVAGVSFADTTQSSLIIKSEKLRLDSTCSNSFALEHDEINPRLETFSWDVTHIEDDEIEHIEQAKKIRKAQKCSEDADAPTSVVAPSVERVFDAGEAAAKSADFTFSKFGKKDEPGLFTFGCQANAEHSSVGSIPPVQGTEQFKTPHPVSHPTKRHVPPRKSKEPLLNQQFPSKLGGYELKIISQPEEQHRARYLTEGSRGAVKNRTGEGYPCVKLFGYNDDATLQVFIGNDTGRVRPHGFYQACKVCGKNATMCTDKEIDGTSVIEIDLRPVNDMTASVDCVGILKLRNADVEQRIGIAKAKKKSTKARMIFRVNFTKSDGNTQTLQIASHPILCTQPIGQPEICKMSLKLGLANGGEELFIIGKNFLRGTKVFFQELSEENGEVKWEKESEIDRDYFQPTHIVCTIPEYGGPQQGSGTKTECQVVINSGGKLSEGQPFSYVPAEAPASIKQEVPMETEDSSKKTFAAPEALELNQQIQQVQQESELFQLPPGVIAEPAPIPEERTHVPMDQGRTPVPMEQGNSLGALDQTQVPSEYTELLNEHKALLQSCEDQKFQTTCTNNTDNFLSEKSLKVTEIETKHTPEPVPSNLQIRTDSFSFEPSSLGISKAENAFTPSASYSDSIVSQFLENMSEALQSQNDLSKNTSTGSFSTSLSTIPTQSHNQNTIPNEATSLSESSSGHLFNNEQSSSMDYSLNSSPVKFGLHDIPVSQPSDASLKDILSYNILNNLDNLHYSLDKGSASSIVSNSGIHLPTDTMLSSRESQTVEARITTSPVMSDSSTYQTNLVAGPMSSPMKNETNNKAYHASSENFELLTDQQRQCEMISQSLGITDSIPDLAGPFQENQAIPDSVNTLEHIAGSVSQSVSVNTNTIPQGRQSTDSLFSPPPNINNSLQEQSPGSVKIKDNTPIQSPENQILRRNSSSSASLSSSPGLGTRGDLPSHNIPSSLNQNMSNQLTSGQVTGSGLLRDIAFSHSLSVQGTNTSVCVSTTQSQPGLVGNVQQNLTGNPQIIICGNQPTQGTAQQTGPSIIINVAGGTGGQSNQMESLIRSIIGTLAQPPPQQQQTQQQPVKQQHIPQQQFQQQQHTQQQMEHQISQQSMQQQQRVDQHLQQQHVVDQQVQHKQQSGEQLQQQQLKLQEQHSLHQQLQDSQLGQHLHDQQQLQETQRLQQFQLHDQQTQLQQQQQNQLQQQNFQQQQTQLQQQQQNLPHQKQFLQEQDLQQHLQNQPQFQSHQGLQFHEQHLQHHIQQDQQLQQHQQQTLQQQQLLKQEQQSTFSPQQLLHQEPSQQQQLASPHQQLLHQEEQSTFQNSPQQQAAFQTSPQQQL